MPGQPDLVDLLSRDPAFVNAVAARSTRDAAAAALSAVRTNWRTFAPVLRPAGAPGGAAAPGAGGAGAMPAALLPGDPAGHAAARRPGDAAAPGAAPAAAAAAVAVGVPQLLRAGTRPLEKQGSLLRATRAPLKLKDFVKAMRRELAAAEERVPWSLVENRWRAQRKNWQRRVRQADSVQGLAGCIWELHGILKTDKGSGLFASGGQWERSLLQVANGGGNQLQLQTTWEEMRGALQSWLERQTLPGSSASLDKGSYAQAVRTFNVLQEAAAKGPDYLDQVPLDQILSTQRELLALQSIISREHAALTARLAEAAAAGGGGGGEGGAAGDAGAPPADGLIASIGQLPAIRGEGDDDEDTDGDAGSEATDMDDSE
ncbi:hypothetical protein Rsub_05537 [Raphidocelis subcapitata]|uniref:Uncharacterized protein n=1 Tax=Raphidocelis subcapitata TaxID=307507 RepID=A0A2V0P5H5_9CHLO|nr:hypothetical protein Rsub_05537 [Raphidocelis subcapitata]|eukprot:GBF92335.1 hypothetical protein Rsub_05537 [Raphidocelis subcapitata]